MTYVSLYVRPIKLIRFKLREEGRRREGGCNAKVLLLVSALPLGGQESGGRASQLDQREDAAWTAVCEELLPCACGTLCNP